MNKNNSAVSNVTEIAKPAANQTVKGPSRRKFLSQVGAALTGGAVLGKAALLSAQPTILQTWGMGFVGRMAEPIRA